MPPWAQVILAAAAVVTAIGVLWRKLLRPGLRLAATAEEMLPLLVELTDTFHDNPHAFRVLDKIVAQFRTDSGSSLRDVVNRLEAAAEEARSANESLRIGAETTRQLAEDDRAQLRELVRLLDRVTDKVDAGVEALDRIEEDRAHVAEDLAAQRSPEEPL